MELLLFGHIHPPWGWLLLGLVLALSSVGSFVWWLSGWQGGASEEVHPVLIPIMFTGSAFVLLYFLGLIP